jgi:peptidoglycan/xylan/chitin deacetylase (PgdA/CDA1 family)
MAWLAARGYQAVTVSELLKAMTRVATRRYLAVTFDDGYLDNLVTALPILQRYGFLATFYIPTSYIGGLSIWNPVDYIGHRPMLSAPGIRALSEAGQEIGSHSHHHRDLTLLDDAGLDEELGRSKKILEDVTAKSVVAFAPPHGRTNRTVADHAVGLGYAHLVKGGRFVANYSTASAFNLRRMTIARKDSLREFAKKVSGAYQWAGIRDR